MADEKNALGRLAELKLSRDRYTILASLSALNIAVRQLEQGQRVIAIGLLYAMQNKNDEVLEQVEELHKYLTDSHGYLDQLSGLIDGLRDAKE